jgi:hypothetical protein
MESSFGIDHGIGKLAGDQMSLAYTFHKRRVLLQCLAVSLMRVQDSNAQVQNLFYHPDRFCKV